MKFLLIDHNNVECDVRRLGVSKDVVLVYAVGTSQTEPVDMFAALRELGHRVYMVRKPASAMASTKFFIFATLGQLIQRYPGASITVVSTDEAYDRVIASLHAKGITNVARITGKDLTPVAIDLRFTLQDEIDAKIRISRVSGKYAVEIEQDIALLARLSALSTPRTAKAPAPKQVPVRARPLTTITLRRVAKTQDQALYSSRALLPRHPLASVSVVPLVLNTRV